MAIRIFSSLRALIVLAAMVAVSTPLRAQEWTHAVDLAYAGDGSAPPRTYRTYLWLPPSVMNSTVHALLLTSETSSEVLLNRDSTVRAFAERNRVALVYMSGGPLGKFIENIPAHAVQAGYLTAVLDSLAKVSGFTEIKHAPWILFGHSASANFVKGVAFWKPERTISMIPYKSGLELLSAPSWATQNLKGIPYLLFQGQFEETNKAGTTDSKFGSDTSVKISRDYLLNARRADPEGYLVAQAVLAGEGHMLYSKRAVPLLVSFMEKTLKKRVPQGSWVAGPPTLLKLNAKEGFVGEADVLGLSGMVKVDSAATAADAAGRFWLIDREFANQWKDFVAPVSKQRNKVGSAAPTISPAPAKAPRYSDGLPRWTDLQLAPSVSYEVGGASSAGLPVYPMIQTGFAVLENGKIRYHPAYGPATMLYDQDLRIGLRSDGNETYGVGDRGIFGLNQGGGFVKGTGAEQTLSIPAAPAAALKPGDQINLGVTASSGLPVEYAVIYGPGRIEGGNKLVVTGFPTRTGKGVILVGAGQAGNASTMRAEAVPLTFAVTGQVSALGTRGIASSHFRKNHRNTSSALRPLFQAGKSGPLKDIRGKKAVLAGSR